MVQIKRGNLPWARSYRKKPGEPGFFNSYAGVLLKAEYCVNAYEVDIGLDRVAVTTHFI